MLRRFSAEMAPRPTVHQPLSFSWRFLEARVRDETTPEVAMPKTHFQGTVHGRNIATKTRHRTLHPYIADAL